MQNVPGIGKLARVFFGIPEIPLIKGKQFQLNHFSFQLVKFIDGEGARLPRRDYFLLIYFHGY